MPGKRITDHQVHKYKQHPITPAATPHSPAKGVYEVLSQSRAQLQRSAALGDAPQLAQWHNSYDHTRWTIWCYWPQRRVNAMRLNE